MDTKIQKYARVRFNVEMFIEVDEPTEMELMEEIAMDILCGGQFEINDLIIEEDN